MDKTLSREQFNTLLAVAEETETQSPEEPAREQAVVPYDFRRVGLLTKDQLQTIRSLHETFARALNNSLGRYLHGALEISVVSVEQITYSEFLRHVPEVNYIGAIAIHPLGATAAVGLDLPLALPIIDMLLGGTGSPVSEIREPTEIEEEILGTVIELICRDLEAAWLPFLKLEFRFQHRPRQAQLSRLMSPKERVLSLALEIRTAEVRGMLTLALPAVVANTLLRGLDEQGKDRRPAGSSSDSRHLRNVLEQCHFHAELVLPGATVSARRLLRIKVGEVLEFPVKVAEPTLFKVENQILFLARPVSVGDRRAAEMITRAAATRPHLKEDSH
jgi:flagellar motor switch protein FliM